jgi:uncharacterized membrane protein
MQIGRRLFATAAAALGAIGLAWGAFAFFWQPVPPDFPGYEPLAYLAGTLLLAGGIAVHFDRSSRLGGWILAIVFAGFSIPWAIRILRFPQLFGTWGGFAEEFALVVAAAIVAEAAAGRPKRGALDLEQACILAFGACAVAFGLNHFFALEQTASLVPRWIPPGRMFWAVATGIFHLLAGLAILSGVRSLLAARLLGAMVLGFSALVWLPKLLGSPAVHMVWAGNAVNLALAGAAFVVADAIARRVRDSSATSGSDGASPPRSGSPECEG